MKRKIIRFLIVLFIFFIPNSILADNVDSIIILVDELSFDIIEDLSLEKHSIGLVNYKTRPPYYKENLLLSINTGRKLSLKEFKTKNAKIDYLGDVLKDEKVAYIGGKTGKLLVSNKKGEVDFHIGEINYDIDWLVEKTDYLLKDSNVLLLSYDFDEEPKRIDILKGYLENYRERNIIILPEGVAEENKSFLNRFIVPFVYINGIDSGILTSQSTNRLGFIALEDISVHLKSIYGLDHDKNVGKPFEIIEVDNPMGRIREIYSTTINLLILTVIFHGLFYFTQFVFSIKFLKYKKVDQWIYMLYYTLAASIPVSIIFGIFNFHKNIVLYLLLSILISYALIRFINKKKLHLIKTLSIITYCLIVAGTLFYPNVIYNSFIGFNNLVYGARYYGLNNGIMGVLLISSILLYFSSIKGIYNEGYKKILGLIIFALNMLTLSARFGANTGGFITSVVLFGLMFAFIFSLNKITIKKVIVFLFLIIGIFAINMLLDHSSSSRSHAIEFIYRIKNNGLWEFMNIVSFKAKELLRLTIAPPFSIVLVSQILVLRKMKGFITQDLGLRQKTLIVFITALVGMILNDTGPITFIYMMFFFILDLIYNANYNGWINLNN